MSTNYRFPIDSEFHVGYFYYLYYMYQYMFSLHLFKEKTQRTTKQV